MSRTPLLKGDKPGATLSPEQIKRLVEARKDGATMIALAERFHVSRQLVSQLLRTNANERPNAERDHV